MRDAAEYLGVLTKREREVAVLACDGLSNKTIAHKLSVTEGTVKHHLHAIYQKLGVPNKAGLIIALVPSGMRLKFGVARSPVT